MENTVFIVLDSCRKDRISVYNKDIDFTENLEEFSEDAAVFEQAVANAPWTLPSHASMFTGLYPWEHGATQRNLQLDVKKDTLAERLNSEGYRSLCISTNAWLSGKFGLTEGFDRVDNMSSTGFSEKFSKLRRAMDEWLSRPGQEQLKRTIVRVGNQIFHYWNGGSQTENILEESEKFIESGDEPFFLMMNLMDAHEPYFPPKEYREKHNTPEPRDICQDPTDYHMGRKEPDFDGISRIYNASVDYMDDIIGEFFDYLKENGLWEETAIVVVSDHGQILGENGDYGHQFSVDEPLVSVPVMVKGLDQREIKQQVELRELYDIVLDVTGIETGYEAGSEYAKGGYEFPDMMRPRIPPDKWKKFYRRHKFVRSPEGRLTVTETEGGEIETEFESFDQELAEDERDRLEEELDEIGSSEKGEDLDDKSEEIKKKLGDLGYG